MPYTTSIDRATGIAGVSIPEFNPMNSVKAPDGATHVRFVVLCATIDFENSNYEIVTAQSADIALTNAKVPGSDLTGELQVNSPHPMFVVLGVEFYQQVNGVSYALKGGKSNALCLVKVSGV